MNKHQLMALLPGLWERWHVCMDPQRLVPDTPEEWTGYEEEQLLLWSTKRQNFWVWDSYNPASWTLRLAPEETFVLDTPSGRVYGEWEVTEAVEKGCLWVRFFVTSEHDVHSFHNQRLLFDGWTLRRDEGDKLQMFQRSMTMPIDSVTEWKEAEVMASLRQLLSVSPSREAWKHLCCWLEIWETTDCYEQITAYLQEHLRDWDDHFRSCPWHWLLCAVYPSVWKKTRRKSLVLCRSLWVVGVSAGDVEFEEMMEELCEREELRFLTSLSLQRVYAYNNPLPLLLSGVWKDSLQSLTIEFTNIPVPVFREWLDETPDIQNIPYVLLDGPSTALPPSIRGRS